MVIPCFNEANTLRHCFQRVTEARLPDGWGREITIVDDHSSSETETIARDIVAGNEQARLIRHDRNRGKGAAVRTGFSDALGRAGDDDAIVVQDADLEYDPNDIAPMLKALEGDGIDAVYGDRFDRGRRVSPLGRLHTLVNRSLTHLSNLATGLRVHDMECCYKCIRAPLAKRILPELSEDRFGIEPQVTAALARAGAHITNLPVSYQARGFDEGKKIGARDGMRAVTVILKEWFRRGPR